MMAQRFLPALGLHNAPHFRIVKIEDRLGPVMDTETMAGENGLPHQQEDTSVCSGGGKGRGQLEEAKEESEAQRMVPHVVVHLHVMLDDKDKADGTGEADHIVELRLALSKVLAIQNTAGRELAEVQDAMRKEKRR